MFKRTLSAFVVLAATLLGTTLTAAPASAFDRPARYVVTFHPGVDPHAMGTAWSGLGFKVVRVYGTLLSGVAVDLTSSQAAVIASDPNVARLEADVVVRASATQAGATWALDRLDSNDDTRTGVYTYPNSAGSGVQVYLVDSGLQSGFDLLGHTIPHKEFAGRVGNGFSFIQDNEGTLDCFGHGTHVAGSIASTTYGVAKLATVTPVRVLDCDGYGTMSDVVAALDWIAASRDRSKPTVVNISVSGPASDSLDEAVNRLSDAGVTIVVAAGNDGSDACRFSPARAGAAVAVGATTNFNAVATFSNNGPCVDVFAPGVDIESTSKHRNKEFASSAGTSSASAFVAGVAALILADNPAMSPAEVRARIAAIATPGVLQKVGEGAPNLLVRVPGAS